MPPTVLATLDDTGVKDLRRRYRSAASDHWSIAVGFAKQNPELAGLFRDDAPRTALVEPAIEVVDKT